MPSNVVSTRELIERMPYKPPFDLEDITGIKERRVHSKVDGAFEDSFVLALSAAQDALSRSGYRAADLDVIISGSIVRYKDGHTHYSEPPFALFLKRALGATSAQFFDVSNACAGMMSGIYLLDRMIKAGVVRNGLVVSGECITPIADTAVEEINQPFDSQFGSLTVGDAGVAVILDGKATDADKIHQIELMTSSEYSHLCIGMPSDRSAGPALYTNNHEMHKEDRLQLWPTFQSDVLRDAGSSFAAEKYDYIIHHQVSSKFIARIQKHAGKLLEAEMPESLACVEKYGNTASTSHFVVLYEHLKEKKVKKGGKFLLVPAASGIVTGCLSATISSLEV
jgi:3-oxoacyl-[acyl-carrier-protein] synthase III